MLNILAILSTIGIFSLFVWLIQTAITHKADELSLKREIDSLKKEKSELKQKISDLERENIKFKEQTSKKPLQKDQKFGYYLDESGHKYCPPCYESTGKTISLQPCGNREYGWECPICKNSVRNPDYNPKPFYPPRHGDLY